MTQAVVLDRALHTPGESAQWWRHAVIYQVYPRSFADSDGDGLGDLPGITARLDHLAELGVDALWLSPFYRSPQADAGYDVADYRAVDPALGTLADADALLARAHELGLRVIVDLVPNHTSDEHAWFAAALAAGPGSAERARYVFREGLGETGEEPPNNWQSVFGGPAWTRVQDRPDAPGSPWARDGQWYLHLFDTKQPDLNWENPQVRAEFEDVLRFWLDRGVDGFRVDVAHGLVKAPGLPDWSGHVHMVDGAEEADGSAADGRPGHPRPPMFDQDGVHEIYRAWNRVLAGYDGDRVLVAEAWVDPVERLARYVRAGEMHQAFNFAFLVCPWRAEPLRATISASYRANDAVGAPTTWVLSNHDVVRHASRLGLPVTGKGPNGIGAQDPQPDAALGLRRARAATLLMLALPGSAYLYQGEELGLPEHTALPDELRQDPAFFRTGGAERGRDGCRVPLPWQADAPGLGFSPTGRTWLPQPADWAELAVDAQRGRPGSTLELYRQALALRRSLALGTGGLTWEEAGTEVLALRNDGPGRPELLVLTNLGTEPVALPAGYRVLLSSTDGAAPGNGARGAAPGNGARAGGVGRDAGSVPPDVTVWATR